MSNNCAVIFGSDFYILPRTIKFAAVIYKLLFFSANVEQFLEQ
jgi:hypothetical protein